MNPKIKYALIAFIVSVSLFLVMGIPSALIPVPLIKYTRMIPATGLDYFFLAITALLLGILISLKLYFKSDKNGFKAIAGGGMGFIAFSCPVCNIFLVSLLGFTAVALIEPLRPFLGVLSAGILVYLIYIELTCKKCRN